MFRRRVLMDSKPSACDCRIVGLSVGRSGGDAGRRRGGDVPGQQLMQAVDLMRADAGNHGAQVGLHAVERGRADQRVEEDGALASGVAAGEEPILSFMQSST